MCRVEIRDKHVRSRRRLGPPHSRVGHPKDQIGRVREVAQVAPTAKEGRLGASDEGSTKRVLLRDSRQADSGPVAGRPKGCSPGERVPKVGRTKAGPCREGTCTHDVEDTQRVRGWMPRHEDVPRAKERDV